MSKTESNTISKKGMTTIYMFQRYKTDYNGRPKIKFSLQCNKQRKMEANPEKSYMTYGAEGDSVDTAFELEGKLKIFKDFRIYWSLKPVISIRCIFSSIIYDRSSATNVRGWYINWYYTEIYAIILFLP